MATIVLTVVGTAVGGPVGGMIGAAVGGYLDAAFIMPKLFPSPTQKMSSGRLSEIQIQSSCEGSPINRCYGAEVRCAGTCIWVSNLIEVKKTEETGGGKGGGGGGGAEITTYSYFVDIAIGVCKGPVVEIARIWADGKLIYSNENIYTEASMDGSIVPVGKQMDIVYDSDEVLPDFIVGKTVGISGVLDENEGYFILSRKFIDGLGMTHLRLKNKHAVAETIYSSVVHLIQPAYEIPTGQSDSITIYLGDDNNLPDPTLESYEGVGNVPNFNGLCYVVFHKLKLTDYGNRIPNFSFLVKDYSGTPG